MINIIGFAFSLSVFLVLILFILHESSYDRYHSDSEYIYRLIDVDENSSSIDYRVKDILLEKYTGLKKACIYSEHNEEIPISHDGNGLYLDGIASVDNAYFQIFDIDILEGNRARAFESLNSVVITESSSKHIFGQEDPIGKELKLMGIFELVVSAVIRDFPDNSSFSKQVFINAENDEFKMEQIQGDSEDQSTYRWPFRIYLQLREGNDPDDFVSNVNADIKSLSPYVKKAGLLPLHDIYLHDQTNGSNTKRGNPGLLALLLGIALIIVLMALVNYINLSLAQKQKRNKEIGIRKTIGATKQNLVMQFVVESVLVIIISFALALLIFELSYPFTKNLFGISLTVKALFEFPLNLLSLVILLSLGIITGLYPALSFASFNPISILGKGPVVTGPKRYSRNFLTVLQFAVSITLIFCAIVIWKQIDYTKHKDLGFSKDQLLKIQLPPPMDPAIVGMTRGFVNEMTHYVNISNFSPSFGVPGEIKYKMGSGIKGKKQWISIIYTDTSFINTFNISLIQGRNFLSGDEGKSCLINQSAFKFFEWQDLENKRYENGGGFDVIGVVEDFHTGSLHEYIQPTAIIFDRKMVQQLTLKVKGNKISETMEYIHEKWNEHLAEFPMRYSFYDDWFATLYEKEERFGEIISYFTLLGIIISGIGIFGLAIFNAEQKTKEIGVRKVNGATVPNVLFLLTKEYTMWVLFAFIIAIPIAFVLMDNWLQSFAYRTGISWWVPTVSGLFALFIAWSSIIWHSLKAALKNPVEALRYE